MRTKGKISTFQLFTLLTVSRLLSTLTFMPSFPFEAGVSDYIVATLFGGVFLWISCIPLFIYLRRNSFAKPNKAVVLLYCIFFVLMLNFVLLRLRQFVSSVFFNSVSSALFTVLTVAAVLYCASFSLEALSRAASISFVLLIASLSIIFIALNGSLDINKLSPAFYYGFTPVLKLAVGVLVRSVEPAVIYILAPRVDGNIRKGLKIWLVSITAVITLCGLFLMLSLSDSALIHAFPFHAMAQLSSFSVIERMDAVFAGIWILSAFIKAVLFSLIIKELALNSFPKIKQRVFLFIFGLMLTAALIFEEKSVMTASFFSSLKIREILFFVFVVGLPSALMIIKGNKTEKAK